MNPEYIPSREELIETRKNLIQQLSYLRLSANTPTVFGIGGSHEFDQQAFNDSQRAIDASRRAKALVEELEQQLAEINRQFGLKEDTEELG